MKKSHRKVTLYDANDARAIPMRSLLDALGMKPDNRGRVRCPFPDHHKHRDAHPSAGIYLLKNKLHCFVSGESWSTIDLVMKLRGMSNGEAIKWLGETFHLPEKESRISFKGKGTSRFSMNRKIVDLKRKRKPTIIEQVIASPGYRDLKPATVKVGLMLLAQMPEEDPVVKLSQRELAEMAGYQDSEPIKRAIDELERIGILAVQKHGNKRTTFRATPLDPAFKRWLETGKPSDPASGNPGQNTGTVHLSLLGGSGSSVSDDDLASWCAAADRFMKDFHSYPEEFLWKLKEKPELETLRLWLAGKPTELTLQALRIFARTERSKGTEDACRRFVHARNRYLKLAKESPIPPAEEPGPELPNAISKGKLLDWFDLAAAVVNQYGMRFENTLTRDEEDSFRQWIGTHTWGYTIMALHRLADGEGKTSPDPCRLYFDKRDDYYRQAEDFMNAPAPGDDTAAALQVDPGPREEGEDSRS
jgi:predicted transcriptional regulator